MDKILDIELLGQRLCTLELLQTGKIPQCTFQLKEMSNFSLTFTKTELLLNSFINNMRWKRKEGETGSKSMRRLAPLMLKD